MLVSLLLTGNFESMNRQEQFVYVFLQSSNNRARPVDIRI